MFWVTYIEILCLDDTRAVVDVLATVDILSSLGSLLLLMSLLFLAFLQGNLSCNNLSVITAPLGFEMLLLNSVQLWYPGVPFTFVLWLTLNYTHSHA